MIVITIQIEDSNKNYEELAASHIQRMLNANHILDGAFNGVSEDELDAAPIAVKITVTSRGHSS